MVIVPSAFPVSTADASGAASRTVRTRLPMGRIMGGLQFVRGESTRTVGRMPPMLMRRGAVIPLLLLFASFAGDAGAAKPNADATAKLLEAAASGDQDTILAAVAAGGDPNARD